MDKCRIVSPNFLIPVLLKLEPSSVLESSIFSALRPLKFPLLRRIPQIEFLRKIWLGEGNPISSQVLEIIFIFE